MESAHYVPGAMSSARAVRRLVLPGRPGRDAWLRGVAWCVIAAACLQVLLFGFGRDQGIYAVVGDSMLRGKMPYRDAWDFKPPGIFFVFALAEALFGKAMASVRIVEVGALLVIVGAFQRLGRTWFGSDVVGLWGGALAVLIHSELEFWHTAQPEIFGGAATAVALVLTTDASVDPSSTARRVRAWMLVGALFGLSFLFKPPLGGGAIVCGSYLSIVEYRRTRRVLSSLLPIGVAAAASFVPIVLVALWFWLSGAWPALSWTLFEFTPNYTKLGWNGSIAGFLGYGFEEAFTGFSYVLPVAIPLALFLPRSSKREVEGLVVVFAVVAIQVVGIAMQAKFFQYHYSATLPLLSLAAGLGLYKAWRFAERLPWLGPALYVAALGALVASRVALRHNPGTYWERSFDRMTFLLLGEPSREELDARLYHVVDYNLDTDRRMAREVARLSAPGDPTFVWGFEPTLYWFANRTPASRYLYDVPQRAVWQQGKARAELMLDLHRNKPRTLVVEHGDVFRFVTGDELDSFAAMRHFPALEAFVEHDYAFVESVGSLDLYLRR